MAYINGAARACPIYINHNGIMLNRSLGFFWRGLSLMRTAATPRGPPGRRRRRGGFRRCRLFLPARTRPPYQCFGVPCVSSVPFRFSNRRAPPLFVPPFGVCRRVCRHRGAVGGSVGGSVATGEQSAIRSCLPDRPRPRLVLFRRA